MKESKIDKERKDSQREGVVLKGRYNATRSLGAASLGHSHCH